jgi:hypothetical protein
MDSGGYDYYEPSLDDGVDSSWDSQAQASQDQTSVSARGEAHYEQSQTIEDGSRIDRDEVGGYLTVDYPDSWQPDGATGDSEVTVQGEIYREESESIGGGTHTESSTWGGSGSVDY